jgi:hypothetical protein
MRFEARFGPSKGRANAEIHRGAIDPGFVVDQSVRDIDPSLQSRYTLEVDVCGGKPYRPAPVIAVDDTALDLIPPAQETLGVLQVAPEQSGSDSRGTDSTLSVPKCRHHPDLEVTGAERGQSLDVSGPARSEAKPFSDDHATGAGARHEHLTDELGRRQRGERPIEAKLSQIFDADLAEPATPGTQGLNPRRSPLFGNNARRMGLERENGRDEAHLTPGLDAGTEQAGVAEMHTIEIPDRDRPETFGLGASGQRFDAKFHAGFVEPSRLYFLGVGLGLVSGDAAASGATTGGAAIGMESILSIWIGPPGPVASTT